MTVVAERVSLVPQNRDERRALGVACGAHALHDGYTDLVYLMLPIWQAEFGLSYAAVGALRTLFSGTMAALQIPSGLIAEKIGAAPVLAIGTALAGCGYIVAGTSAGLAMLAMALILGGIGASTQHPLASALVTHAFAGPRSIKAFGTYNFAGDIGKMTVPAAGAFLIWLMPWRPAVALLGACGFAAAIAVFALVPRVRGEAGVHTTSREAAGTGAPGYGFPLLLSIGVIDSATRSSFLVFLPFVLTAKGASVPAIGLALTCIFAGGACGKLACAFIGARIGMFATVVLTEGLTALGMLVLLPLSLEASYVLLPLLGVALNGTSTVIYGSVPTLVTAAQRSRAFSIFYTGTIGTGAIAPILAGFLGDLIGVHQALYVIAALVLVTLPLALALRPALAAAAAAERA